MRVGAVGRELRASLSVLWTRRFGTFWGASLLSNIGTWAQQVAEPWLLLSLGAPPFLIGLDSFATNAPVVLGGAAMTVSSTSANSLLQSTASPRLLGQTASLFMLAMRGGLSLGSLLTGASIAGLGVRHALLVNGLVAVAANVAIGRTWVRSKLPVGLGVSPGASVNQSFDTSERAAKEGRGGATWPRRWRRSAARSGP